ncbi:MAG: peptidylprolyl isomerase [Flavobacteriales bacterium]|nr:peptidylprolyl isomerase [Flavobacteriales bacterium]
MRNLLIIVCAIGFALPSYGQEKGPVLMTVNNIPVYKTEFEQIYWKNKKENVATKEDLDEYMELFTKFKLKVTEAEDLGMDTLASFIKELDGYKVQLEKPYLVDKNVNEKLITEAYDRINTEIRASHILIKMDGSASPEDTLKAYNRINNIREKILRGDLTFAEAAKRMSEDESAKQNHGDLGYFTAFRMVYSFESAAFNTPVGEISQPFRSRFGYHIVKTVDSRAGRGSVKVSHLMLSIKKDMSDLDKENLKKKIYELYEKLGEGESFVKLAKEFSEDRQSKLKMGQEAWLKPGEAFLEFDSVAFSLNNNGDYSTPFLTKVGWHIIKKSDYKPVGDLESMRHELKNKIQRDVRAQISKGKFIVKLKEEYAFNEVTKNKKELYKVIDNSVLKGKWNPESTSKLEGELFSFADRTYSQQDFASYIASTQKPSKNKDIVKFIDNKYSKYVANMLMAYERTQLSKKYPEFRDLLKEYRDGILLFGITDEKVWSKGVEDTVGLKEYYELHKNEYMWPDRVDAKIFTSSNKKSINTAYKLVKKGKIGHDSIVNYLNKESQLNIKFENGRFVENEKEVIKDFSWATGLNKPKLIDELEGKYSFVIIEKKLPSQVKELQEAKGLITAAYQDYLESTWLDSLRKKYPIQINKDILYSIAGQQ